MHSDEAQQSAETGVTGMAYGARTAYWVIAWLFVAALLAQVYLIGLAFLAAQPTLEPHVGLGHTLGILLLPLLVLTYVARHPRPLKYRTWLLLGVYIMQAEVFAVIRSSVPVVAALHPVLALVLFWLAVTVAVRSRAYVGRRVPSQATASHSAEAT